MTKYFSRRRLLLAGAALVPTASMAQPYPWRPNQSDAPVPVSGYDYRFFHPEESAFIEAAVDRLIPADGTGPGAKDAGVALFLDRQLGGGYGMGERTYLKEPFASGQPTQGYQMHAPAVAYREAIASVNAYAQQTHGAPFARLSANQQDDVLKHLEKGDIQLNGSVGAKAFFDLLWQNTLEGYFADPLYGGNRSMGAWRMIGFPGARYDYRAAFAHINERLPYQPVSLAPSPGAHS